VRFAKPREIPLGALREKTPGLGKSIQGTGEGVVCMGFDTLRVKVQIDLESLCGGIMLGCMNEKDFINLIHDVKRHEDAVTEDAKEIRELKVDVWELSNLVRLLAAFVPRPVSGMVEEKAAIEFETQLRAVLQKHGIER
jgi:hypothetical protein